MLPPTKVWEVSLGSMGGYVTRPYGNGQTRGRIAVGAAHVAAHERADDFRVGAAQAAAAIGGSGGRPPAFVPISIAAPPAS